MFLEKKKGKQMLLAILILPLLLAAAPPAAHAQELTAEPENIGVSEICPEDSFEESTDAQLHSASRPSKVWNIATKGKYSFKGVIKKSGTVLYTDYKFKGKTQYSFLVKNTGDATLTVKAKRLTKTYTTTKIKAGGSAKVSISSIQASTEFYLTFEGSSFSGYIQ